MTISGEGNIGSSPVAVGDKNRGFANFDVASGPIKVTITSRVTYCCRVAWWRATDRKLRCKGRARSGWARRCLRRNSCNRMCLINLVSEGVCPKNVYQGWGMGILHATFRQVPSNMDRLDKTLGVVELGSSEEGTYLPRYIYIDTGQL